MPKKMVKINSPYKLEEGKIYEELRILYSENRKKRQIVFLYGTRIGEKLIEIDKNGKSLGNEMEISKNKIYWICYYITS